jgi:molybdopterin-containing oxidoreductase family iron-sulfur binding subunit
MAPMDLGSIRARLDNLSGETYWRTLDELAEAPEFQAFVHEEFPDRAPDLANPLSRRQFLRLMGASLAFAGVSGCGGSPSELIVPYVRKPDDAVIPGKPLFFATAMAIAGFATGLLVESHLGRPTKIEGNPLHPASLGATDAYAQASILTLYDPDRSNALTYAGRIRPWSQFQLAAQKLRSQRLKGTGEGLRILTGTITSPTLASQLRALLDEFPAAQWHQWEPAGRHHTRAGALLAFGQPVGVQYRIDQADVILTLDGDPLTCAGGNLRYVRDFAQRRRPVAGGLGMNRLYAVESTPSSTGAAADHRLALAMNQMEEFARRVAAAVGVKVTAPPASAAAAATERWISAVARDLLQHRGASLVIAGEPEPPAVHALAHAMNAELGNVGKTVVYSEAVEAVPVDEIASLRELVEAMNAGAVDTLIIAEGNPAYTAPADFRFAEALQKVRLRIHRGLFFNETSALCHWHIPAAHYLESWSDARAYDGTVTIVQPLIAPLYRGKTAHELLAAFSQAPQQTSYEIVRGYWRGRFGKSEEAFESFWRQSLHDGIVEGTALPAKQVTLKLVDLVESGKRETEKGKEGESSASQNPKPEIQNQKSLELVFRPDPSVFDGRFANNAWLQELPKPVTKITWDNVAQISPATAERLGLNYHLGAKGGTVYTEVIELSFAGRSLRAPAWIVPGHADDSITVHLGYGRQRAGGVGSRIGFDAYGLRTSEAIWFGQGLTVRQTGDVYPLAQTQTHHQMEGRELVRAGTSEQFLKDPNFAHKMKHGMEPNPSLYPEYKYDDNAWGMAIDLSLCIGCNACVVACQAENNIPVVGKEEVLRSREMHWLRIDSYFKGPPENPETYYQPVPCMHCEKAPCELVCPVAATSHSAEGLNDMVYNRCVGTRYCSNNCPYKVRRFNFLQYSDWETESLKPMRNPDVTVRSRGVMEKCTYCVQRITSARIEADKEGRRIRDGEVVTACQQACPAQAIVFGNINDPASVVHKQKADPRNYALLEELNTQPRTTYLAALRNPNPELVNKASAGKKQHG